MKVAASARSAVTIAQENIVQNDTKSKQQYDFESEAMIRLKESRACPKCERTLLAIRFAGAKLLLLFAATVFISQNNDIMILSK